MECTKLLLWLSIILIILIGVFVKRSTFGAMDENGNVFLSNTYANEGCGEIREYPQGKVPGSYLGLTNAEKEGLLTNFILDNPNKLT